MSYIETSAAAGSTDGTTAGTTNSTKLTPAPNGGHRLEWLDYAKLIGIYLVIYWHTPLNTGYIAYVFHIFVMASFFFLSGVTQRERPFLQELKHSIRGILVPYFTLYILAYLCNRSSRFIPWLLHNPRQFIAHKDDILEALSGVFTGKLYAVLPYWFLLALFWIRLIFALAVSIARGNRKLYYIVQFLIMALFIAITLALNPTLPYKLHSSIQYYPYFALGAIFKSYIIRVQSLKTPKANVIRYLVCLAALAVLLGIARVNCYYKTHYDIVDKWRVLTTIGAFFGITSMLALSALIKLPSWSALWSQNTIIILAFHVSNTNPLAISTLGKLLPKLNIKAMPFQYGLITAFMSLVLCAVPIYIIVRYLPWTLGRQGKRHRP